MKPGPFEKRAGEVRIDLPPGSGDEARLPADFGRRFTVSIDTEEEFDWDRPLTRGPHGTGHGKSFPRIQELLGSAGVVPLYFVDYPIAVDPACADILGRFQADGACEIGAHLHPWVTPPLDEPLSPANSFAGNLPIALERAKLRTITEAIAAAFGRRPSAYRAGRYGIGPHSGALLIEAGYKVDASVRPLFDYRGEGGPDFTAFPVEPYWTAGGALLEVPLTVGLIGPARRLPQLYRQASRVPRGPGLLSRSGLASRVALSPEGVPLAQALELIDRLLEDGLRLFSLSFHSPSIEPGHTPYVRDQADLAVFRAWWDGVFDRFASRGVEPASMQEISEAAERGRAEGLAPARALG